MYAALISFLEGEPFKKAVEKSSPNQLYQIAELDLINMLEIMNKIGITNRNIDSRNVLAKGQSLVIVPSPPTPIIRRCLVWKHLADWRR